MAYQNRMETAYRVVRIDYRNRMEIVYKVLAEDQGVTLSGVSTIQTVGMGRLIAPTPVLLQEVSSTETVGVGDPLVAVYLSGSSATIHVSAGSLILRPHLGGVGILLTAGSGRLSRRISLAGNSVMISAGHGNLISPVEIDGTSVTETEGVGGLLAPYPEPIQGPWITITAGSGTLFLTANLRGPSLSRTAGRGLLRVVDQGTELSEARALVSRLPDTYAKHEGSRIFRLFRVLAVELVDLRRALITTERMRDIDQATGATLERIGHNVRQPRGQLPDGAYRALIKAKIARHMSPGDVDSIKQVVSAMLGVPMTEVGVQPLWRANPPEPAAVEIRAPMDALARFQLTPDQFVAIMQRVVAAGVRATSLLGGTFELSDVLEEDEERGLADDGMTFGGTLGEYYDVAEMIDLPLEGM